MKTRIDIYILTALLVCRANNVSSAEAMEQPAAAAPETATSPSSKSQPVAQEDLGCVVIDGKTNKVVRVMSADPVSAFVIYESEESGEGGRKILRQELPPRLQAKYPYDAAKAAEHRKQQADLAAEQAALSVQQAARARAAAREVSRQKEREVLAQIDSLNKQDVELQKQVNILNKMPAGGGRRLKAKQLSGQQEVIRQYIDRLNSELAKIRAQIAGTN